MRLPRFRLRTLMILVMLAGVGVGGLVFWRRAAEYRRFAEQWGPLERLSEESLQIAVSRFEATKVRRERVLKLVASEPEYGRHLSEYNLVLMDEAKLAADSAERARTDLTYVRSMRLKYDRAARYPFLPVAADPPEPE